MSRLRKAWDAWPEWADDGERDHFFAETAGKARAMAYRSWSNAGSVTFREIIVRRAKHKDVVLPDEHRLVADLSPEQRQMVAHAFGRDRHGSGYRDHYCVDPGNLDMLSLAWEFGLFSGPWGERAYGDTGMWCGAFFYLTELGKLVAASMLPTYGGDHA
ncbi:MAG TPA: hypothetical protein VK558_12280 [Patescibacteria group bacterium]|nr:hypothetical protein [Patescibacteria group bacterium]